MNINQSDLNINKGLGKVGKAASCITGCQNDTITTCTASYTVGTGGSAVRHQTNKTVPVLHIKLHPCVTRETETCFIRKTVTLYHT